MVAQVFADAGQFVHDVDSMLAQDFWLADAGELQQFRRVHRAAADDDFAGGARFALLACLFVTNPDTLFAVRGGVLVSKFDVSSAGSTAYSETFYGGGPSFGVSMESKLAAIDPNLNLRIGAVYTDFLTAPVSGLGSLTSSLDTNEAGHDSEITGSALSARIGLTYSFFDVNSLF